MSRAADAALVGVLLLCLAFTLALVIEHRLGRVERGADVITPVAIAPEDIPQPASLEPLACRADREPLYPAPDPGTIRDLIHETQATRCGLSADTCPDWALAHAIRTVWRDEGPEVALRHLVVACEDAQRHR